MTKAVVDYTEQVDGANRLPVLTTTTRDKGRGGNGYKEVYTTTR